MVFLKSTCHAKPDAVRERTGSNSKFQDKYFESFEIHQPIIMYCFEHTNHDTFLTFFSKPLQTLFASS